MKRVLRFLTRVVLLALNVACTGIWIRNCLRIDSSWDSPNAGRLLCVAMVALCMWLGIISLRCPLFNAPQEDENDE